MRGASAESLAALTRALKADIDGVVTGEDPAPRMAEDLFAVAAILRREPSLRRMTTDPSLPAEAKERFVRGLLGSRMAGPSLELIASAASKRWAASRDLADSLELLGVIAVVKGATRAGRANVLEDELFAFGRLVSENPDLRDALSDPARSHDDKRALLHSLLDGRVSEDMVRLAEQAVTGSHHTVATAIADYQQVAAEQRQRMVGTVRVASQLSEADVQRLNNALAAQYGRPVHLNVVIDPEVLGGIRVELGNDVIDGTVSTRLADARRRMAG